MRTQGDYEQKCAIYNIFNGFSFVEIYWDKDQKPESFQCFTHYTIDMIIKNQFRTEYFLGRAWPLIKYVCNLVSRLTKVTTEHLDELRSSLLDTQ